MNRALVVAVLFLWCAEYALAGHGMMNAFNDVTPLPEAGLTPADRLYVFDRLNESARLASTRGAGRVELALDFAREKLAELDAMVRLSKRKAASAAAQAYREYLQAAAAELAASPPSSAKYFAQALLEHQFLIALDYLDLPRDSRAIIAEAVAAAQKHYTEVTASLPRSFKAQQFFKEEEIRWSWEMATQADLQGL